MGILAWHLDHLKDISHQLLLTIYQPLPLICIQHLLLVYNPIPLEIALHKLSKVLLYLVLSSAQDILAYFTFYQLHLIFGA